MSEATSQNVLSQTLQPAVNLIISAIENAHGIPAPIQGRDETIESMRGSVVSIWPEAAAPGAFEVLAKEVRERVLVDIKPAAMITHDYKPWYETAVTSGQIRPERWYSYKKFLAQGKGFAPQVLEALDRSSTDVVDLLGDPRQTGAWKRRGLVIGDVQSGKTATYIGIVNKAADAGFKLVVLLTGGTESLRQQTQYRVDEGLLGEDSAYVKEKGSLSKGKIIGVGKFPTQTNFRRGQGMTSHAKDFVGSSLVANQVGIDPNADHPLVFVIKKNKTSLENVISWLTGQLNGKKKFDIPMLVVDDESDYASVNTNYRLSGDTSPSTINTKIRGLLAMTTKSSYMAFTATPFANVFIDHNTVDETLEDDLFPHHYIYALSSPSNYMGATSYFGTAEEVQGGCLVDINDADDFFPSKHKSHLQVTSLPDSLKDALHAFVVASAIRIARGDESPRSMLVNVSRFKNVQAQVFDLVALEFSRIKNAIEMHASPPVTGDDLHEVLSDLGETFRAHFTGAGISWIDTRNQLLAAVIDTQVQLVNSSRNKDVDDKVRNMIAVGGDVLARGLTLDGLTTSYFYRLVGSADTLLQMARWFGYRTNYEDLVRVWISPDVASQFRFVSDICEDLREQVQAMRDLKMAPKDFGLMVRKHPETLAITAKKGVAESRLMVISLAARRIESTKIPAVQEIIAGNDAAVRSFLSSIDDGTGWDQRANGMEYPGKKGVPRARIADLLAAFRFDPRNLILTNALDRIIRDQTGPAFQNWTVGVVSGSREGCDLITGLHVPSTPERSVRYVREDSTGSFLVSGKSARLAGSLDLASTYSHGGKGLTEPDVYGEIPHPTLLIYPLRPKLDVPPASDTAGERAQMEAEAQTAVAKKAWANASAGSTEFIMALKLAIPGRPGDKGGDVEYLLNGPAIETYARDYLISDPEDIEALDE